MSLQRTFDLLKEMTGESFSYCDPKRKNLLHRRARSFLQAFAAELNLQAVTVSSNKAGIAVSGEVSMISGSLYVQVAQFAFKEASVHLLIRGVKHATDYCGLTNRTLGMANCDSVEDVLKVCRLAIHDSETYQLSVTNA